MMGISLYCYYEDFQDKVKDRLGIESSIMEPEVITFSKPMFFSSVQTPHNGPIVDLQRDRDLYKDFQDKIKDRLS